MLDPEADRIAYQIARTEHAMRRALERRLRPHGVTLLGWAVLRQIVREPSISAAELTRQVFVSQQGVSKLLGGLRRAALVQAGGRTGRARVQDYVATARGEEVARTCDVLILDLESAIRVELGPDGVAQIMRHLAQCHELLEQDGRPPQRLPVKP